MPSSLQHRADTATVVMTGGTSGFGRRTLEMFLDGAHGRHVFLIARQSRQAMELANKFGSRRLTIVFADLADLEAVDHAAARILSLLDGKPIDALALNAGVQPVLGDRESLNRLELCFAVNHLAHFHLASRFAGAMRPRGRIIVTSSKVHDPTAFCLVGITRAHWEDPLVAADPDRAQCHLAERVDRGEARYCYSKLLNLLHVRHLAQALPEVASIAFNPSVVPGTEIARDRNLLQILGWKYILPLLAPALPGLRSIERSAGDLAWLLTMPDVGVLSGHYVNGRMVESGSADSRDPMKVRRVVEVSRHLIEANLGATRTTEAPRRAGIDRPTAA